MFKDLLEGFLWLAVPASIIVIIIITPIVVIGLCANKGYFGYSSKDSVMRGLLLNVTQETPILCENHIELHLNLGMKEGHKDSIAANIEDVYISDQDYNKIKDKLKPGENITLVYDDIRFGGFCIPSYRFKNLTE